MRPPSFEAHLQLCCTHHAAHTQVVYSLSSPKYTQCPHQHQHQRTSQRWYRSSHEFTASTKFNVPTGRRPRSGNGLDNLFDACNVDKTKILDFLELGAITPGFLRLLYRSAPTLIHLNISSMFAKPPLWLATETFAPSLIALKTLRMFSSVSLDLVVHLAPSLRVSSLAKLLGPIFSETTSAGDMLLQITGNTLEALSLNQWSPSYAQFLPCLTSLSVDVLPWSSDIPPALPSSLKVLHLGSSGC